LAEICHSYRKPSGSTYQLPFDILLMTRQIDNHNKTDKEGNRGDPINIRIPAMYFLLAPTIVGTSLSLFSNFKSYPQQNH